MKKFLRNSFESLEESICYYSREGELEKVQSLIDEGVDVNCKYRASASVESAPLLSAVRYNQKEMLKLLLDNGADPSMVVGSDEGKNNGYPVYDWCVNSKNTPYYTRLEMLQLMIEKQPDILDPILEIITDSYHVEKYATERQDPEVVAIIAEMKTLQSEINSPIQRSNNEASSLTLRRRKEKGSDDTTETRAESNESFDSNASDGKNPNSKTKANPHKTAPIASSGIVGCNVM